jgi:hypothetical protein
VACASLLQRGTAAAGEIRKAAGAPAVHVCRSMGDRAYPGHPGAGSTSIRVFAARTGATDACADAVSVRDRYAHDDHAGARWAVGGLEIICSGLRPGLGLADRASRHHITWAAPSFFSQPTFYVLARSTRIFPVHLRENDAQDRIKCVGVADVFCFADSWDFAYVSASKHHYH